MTPLLTTRDSSQNCVFSFFSCHYSQGEKCCLQLVTEIPNINTHLKMLTGI